MLENRMYKTVMARLLAAGGLALSVAVTAAGPALADPYPVDGGPDTGTHTYCFDTDFPLNSTVKPRALYSMDNNDGVMAQTNVTTQDYGTSCGTAIDVRFQQRPIPGVLAAGASPCANRVAAGRCGRRDVRIDWANIVEYATNVGYQARNTLCHEIGHTLGVRHFTGPIDNPDGQLAPLSCLKVDINDSGAAWERRYGPDHRAHINAWFS